MNYNIYIKIKRLKNCLPIGDAHVFIIMNQQSARFTGHGPCFQ